MKASAYSWYISTFTLGCWLHNTPRQFRMEAMEKEFLYSCIYVYWHFMYNCVMQLAFLQS